jgi:hypothetical protein
VGSEMVQEKSKRTQEKETMWMGMIGALTKGLCPSKNYSNRMSAILSHLILLRVSVPLTYSITQRTAMDGYPVGY